MKTIRRKTSKTLFHKVWVKKQAMFFKAITVGMIVTTSNGVCRGSGCEFLLTTQTNMGKVIDALGRVSALQRQPGFGL
jgi:hypothetical protein